MIVGRRAVDYDQLREDILGQTDTRLVYERAFGKSAQGKVRRGARGQDYTMVECILHDDSSPSMALYFGKTTPGYTCYSGCGSGTVFDLLINGGVSTDYRAAVEWLRDNGLVGHRFDGEIAGEVRNSGIRLRSNDKGPKLARVDNTLRYEYCDADGVPVSITVRKEGVNQQGEPDKDIYQVHHSRDDGMVCFICRDMLRTDKAGKPDIGAHPGKPRGGLGSLERLLLHLPEVREAAAAGKVVFFPEGEKKTDALRSLGLTVTTNQCGANTRMDVRWADDLRGAKHLYILGDCDIPGRKAALSRVAFFRQQGIPSTYLDIAPERWDGYDIGDWCVEHEMLSLEAKRAAFRELFKHTLAETQALDRVIRVTSQPPPYPSDRVVFDMSKEGVARALATPCVAVEIGKGEVSLWRPLVRELAQRGTPVSFSSANAEALTYFRSLVEPVPERLSVSSVLTGLAS